MRYVFELCRWAVHEDRCTVIEAREEECHADQVQRRAKTLLWTEALEHKQNLIVVRSADNGVEVFRRSVGSGYC